MTISGFVRRVAAYVDRHGLSHTVSRAWEKTRDRVFLQYERQWRKDHAGAEMLEYMKQHPIHDEVGLFSVVIPVYNTAPALLRELADSLKAQAYPAWEACLYDGMSTRQETIVMLDALAKEDERFRIVHGKANDGISGNTNHAVAMAKGEWIALCDHDDLLEPDALYCMADAIRNAAERPGMLYSDEDFINASGTVHTSPHFKPDFCPDTLRASNYVCHLMVLHRDVVEKIGGFRPEMDGSQDHDVALRASEVTKHIIHVPRVLYHWRQMGTSMSHQQLERCLNAGARAVEEHIGRIGYPGKVTHSHALLRIEYNIDKTESVRIVVLHDAADGCAEVSPALKNGLHADRAVVEVRPYTGSPWQSMNDAARDAQEDYIVFLSSKVAMQGDNWLDEMQMYAQRSDVGAACALITDPYGRVLHAGFAVGMENAVQPRALHGSAKGGGWHRILKMAHNVAAVGLGCLMIRREKLISEPFDARYEEGLAAADWSVRMTKKEFCHVLVPFAAGVSTDRKYAKTMMLTGKYRNTKDMTYYEKCHGQVHDSCYSIRFNRRKANYKPAD